jgi:hypothetical protein
VGMAGCPRVLGWALGSTAGRVLRGWSGWVVVGSGRVQGLQAVPGGSQVVGARSPSSARWRSQAVSEVARAAISPSPRPKDPAVPALVCSVNNDSARRHEIDGEALVLSHSDHR